jgi:hypothetical protein
MDFFKKFARRPDAPLSANQTQRQRALDLKLQYERAQSGQDAQALLATLASAFVASYRSEDARSVEVSFGSTQLVCTHWCRHLRDLLKDIWDEQAVPSRNAQRCIALLSNSMSGDQHNNVADVLEAVLICSKLEHNVAAFIESNICAVLVSFLEACLEYTEDVMQSTTVASTVVAVVKNLVSHPAICDALAGTPTFFLLLTLPVRESNAVNASSFCVSCAGILSSSVSSWSQAVLTTLLDANWLGFVLARLDEEGGLVAPACTVAMAEIIVDVLRHSTVLSDGSMLTAFARAGGYARFTSVMRRYAAQDELRPFGLELLTHLANLVYVGKDSLPPPDEEHPMLPRTAPLAKDTAHNVSFVESDRVRNREAFAVLQGFFLLCTDEAMRTKVVDICFGIFACHPHNYLLLQQQHTFAEFLEHFDSLSLALRKRVLGYLVALEEQLHFVPFHELMGLSLLLDHSATYENLELVLQTVRSFVDRNPQYKAYLEQAGIIHIASKTLRGADAQSEARWATYPLVLELLMLLCVDNASNCCQLIKTGGCEALGAMLVRKQTRSSALRLFGQMLIHGQNQVGDVLSILLALLRSKNDKWLAVDVLTQLTLLLCNRWPLKECFRETGGFVSIISLLMSLDGCFGLGVTPEDASSRLVVAIIDTCTAAVSGYAENRVFFCSHVLPSMVGALRLTGILVTGKEARSMLLALMRFMTDSPVTESLEHYRQQLRHAVVHVGEVALVLLELLRFLNDETKFFLLDCMTDLARSLCNSERFAQEEVLLFLMQHYEEQLCYNPSPLVDRMTHFMVRVAAHRISQRECAAFFRILRKHGYPVHLLRAARTMAEKSRTPPIVEFNLATCGFASMNLMPGGLQAVSQSSPWPPQNGWSLVFWLCINDYGKHPIDLCSLTVADNPPITRICIGASGHLQYYASKGIEVSSFEFALHRWYHVAMVWQKKRFSNPEIALFVDGDQVFTGSVPPVPAPVTLEQLHVVIGTPVEDKHPGCRQLWWLGPCYLLDECLDPKILLTLFVLGPGYHYNFQGSSLEHFQMPHAVTERNLKLVAKYQFSTPTGCLDLSTAHFPLDEARILFAIHARSVERLGVTDSKMLRNGVPNRQGAFQEVLLLGGASAFENQGFALSIHKVGGMLAALRACHEAQDSFAEAVRLLVALAHSSWRNARVLEASVDANYEIFAHALSLQSHRLTLETVDILWGLVGLLTPSSLASEDSTTDFIAPLSPHVSRSALPTAGSSGCLPVASSASASASAAAAPTAAGGPSAADLRREALSRGLLSNLKAFGFLFLSFVPWRNASLKIQVKIMEDLQLLVGHRNPHAAFNLWCLERVQAVSRLLMLARDEATIVDLFPALIEFVALMIRVSPKNTMESVAAFLLTTLPLPQPDPLRAQPRPSMGGKRLRASTSTSRLDRMDPDVSRLISLRNMLLEMVHRELGQHMGVLEAFLSSDWIAQWFRPTVHSSTAFVGLRLTATMLQGSASFARQFGKTGWQLMASAVLSFHGFSTVVYLLLAILYGLPGSSVGKVRGDFSDLELVFPCNAPVKNPECVLVIFTLLKEAMESVILASRVKRSFVPISPSRGGGVDTGFSSLADEHFKPAEPLDTDVEDDQLTNKFGQVSTWWSSVKKFLCLLHLARFNVSLCSLLSPSLCILFSSSLSPASSAAKEPGEPVG